MSELRVRDDHELELVSGGSFWNDIGSAIDDLASGGGKALGDLYSKPSGGVSVHDNHSGWGFSLNFSL